MSKVVPLHQTRAARESAADLSGGRMSIVTKETATVYRGAGRRFFTKDAAYRSFAREALRTVCECEEPDHSMGYPGYTCHYHQDEETYQKYVRRLAGFYRERDRQS